MQELPTHCVIVVELAGTDLFSLPCFGLSECEFKAALAIGHGSEAIVRGVDERSSDGFVSHAVDHDAVDGVGGLFFRLRALCMGGRCGCKKQQGQEDFEAWMKVRAHTSLKNEPTPGSCSSEYSRPRCGACISHYIIRPSGAFALGNSRLALAESRSLDCA